MEVCRKLLIIFTILLIPSPLYRRPSLFPYCAEEDTLIVNDAAKATAFNQWFQSVFTEEKLSDLGSLQSFIPTQPSVINSFSFTPDNVLQELIDLTVSKACSPDLIPPLLLKKAAPYICLNYSPSQCHLGSYHRIGSLQMSSLYLKKVIHVFLVTTGLLASHPRWWRELFIVRLGQPFPVTVGLAIVNMDFVHIIPPFPCC